MERYIRALTIAGSDSGGGAGIQADLKTFSALKCYGMSVVTAITAQNTRAVTAISLLEPDIVRAQIDAVFEDIGADAVKIGMLGNPAMTGVVADSLRRWGAANVVVDPVMVAKSGDRLLGEDAIETLRTELLPLAELITPNIPEAEQLLGRSITTRDGMAAAAASLLALGPRAVLVKGGHLDSLAAGSPDVLAIAGEPDVRWLESDRIETRNTHGTGCTLSSAIAAFLARGFPLLPAVQEAKAYLHAAIAGGVCRELGGGHGPVHHFHALWRDASP